MNRLIAALLLAVFASVSTLPAQAATSKAASSKQSKAKSVAKKPASKTKVKSKVSSACPLKRVKTSKGWRSVRDCKSSESVVLRSPIAGDALESKPEPESATKLRAAPERAYAVDGESFFYQGRKYRVAGLEAVEISDMARQRLQRQLESGPLEIVPLENGEDGLSIAQVRIKGSDLATLLK